MARVSWHNWVKQEKRWEREKGNEDWTGTPERELWRRKGTHTLRSNLTNRKISWVRGISKILKRAQQQAWELKSRVREAQIIWTAGTDTTAWDSRGGGCWALRLRLWSSEKLLASPWWTRPVGGRSKPLQLSLTPEVVWPTTAGDIWTKITCRPNHFRGYHRKGHYNGTSPDGALTPLGAHSPCSHHCQTFQEVPICLITVPS